MEDRIKDSRRDSFIARSELDELSELSTRGELPIALAERLDNLDAFYGRGVDLLKTTEELIRELGLKVCSRALVVNMRC